MSEVKKVSVAVNGHRVLGKRVAEAAVSQEVMTLAGVSDVVTDWRAGMAIRHHFRLFDATGEHANAMRAAGLEVACTLDDMLGQADIVVDCTPSMGPPRTSRAIAGTE